MNLVVKTNGSIKHDKVSQARLILKVQSAIAEINLEMLEESDKRGERPNIDAILSVADLDAIIGKQVQLPKAMIDWTNETKEDHIRNIFKADIYRRIKDA